jgi:hypothetical protein
LGAPVDGTESFTRPPRRRFRKPTVPQPAYSGPALLPEGVARPGKCHRRVAAWPPSKPRRPDCAGAARGSRRLRPGRSPTSAARRPERRRRPRRPARRPGGPGGPTRWLGRRRCGSGASVASVATPGGILRLRTDPTARSITPYLTQPQAGMIMVGERVERGSGEAECRHGACREPHPSDASLPRGMEGRRCIRPIRRGKRRHAKPRS